MDAQPGDLVFLWGTSFTDRVIRALTGGPSHVRLCLGDGRVAEMVLGGFHSGLLADPVGATGSGARGARQELVQTHLDPEQQQRCLQYAQAHIHEQYGLLSCVSQFLNLLDCPVVFGVVGQQNCSQFCGAAVGIYDWYHLTPALLYRAVAGRGVTPIQQ